MERPGQEPNAVATKSKGVAPGPSDAWEMPGMREAGGARILLPGPQVLRRMVLSVGSFHFIVGVLVPRTLSTVKGAADELNRTFRSHGRGPNRDGEPIGDLVAEGGQESCMRSRRKESRREGGRGRVGAQLKPCKGDRLAPRPQVIRTRLPEPAEGAGPERAMKGGERHREGTAAPYDLRSDRVQSRVEVGGIEGGPLGGRGGPAPKAAGAPLQARTQRGGGNPNRRRGRGTL